MGSQDEADAASLSGRHQVQSMALVLLSRETARTRDHLGALQERFDGIEKHLDNERQELNTRILSLKNDLLQHAERDRADINEQLHAIERGSENLERRTNEFNATVSDIKHTLQTLEMNVDNEAKEIQTRFALIDSSFDHMKNGFKQVLNQERENRSATLRDHAALKASIADLAKVIQKGETSQTGELKRHLDAVLAQQSEKRYRQDALVNADQEQRLEAYLTVMSTVMEVSRVHCDHKDVTEGKEGLEDARVFIQIYSLLSSYYKILHARPGQTNHHTVITYFLRILNQHASCYLQRRLLELCPENVNVANLPNGSNSPRIFINYEGLSWYQVKHVVHNLGGLGRLQVAVNEQWTGPAQVSKKRKRTSTSSRIGVPAQDLPSASQPTGVAQNALPKSIDSINRGRSLRGGQRVDYKPPRRLAEWVRSG
ncbi:hypothetical protein F5Y18DRAFT_137066 [Xylariaceae sp. FL1019]|nr:hypothetical protein F5Y18DRAFT_137066 [Xylariaceae sp. FL1019]